MTKFIIDYFCKYDALFLLNKYKEIIKKLQGIKVKLSLLSSSRGMKNLPTSQSIYWSRRCSYILISRFSLFLWFHPQTSSKPQTFYSLWYKVFMNSKTFWGVQLPSRLMVSDAVIDEARLPRYRKPIHSRLQDIQIISIGEQWTTDHPLEQSIPHSSGRYLINRVIY